MWIGKIYHKALLELKTVRSLTRASGVFRRVDLTCDSGHMKPAVVCGEKFLESAASRDEGVAFFTSLRLKAVEGKDQGVRWQASSAACCLRSLQRITGFC